MKNNDFALTLDIIKTNFTIFNKKYFDNKLPLPKFGKINKKKPFLAGFAELPNNRFFINFNFNEKIGWDKNLFEDVLLHEMIHFYINRNYKIGKWMQFHYWWPFWFIVKKFNIKYNLNISCSYTEYIKKLKK